MQYRDTVLVSMISHLLSLIGKIFDKLERFLTNTAEGVVANLIAQGLVVLAGTSSEVLPKFFNPTNIFLVILSAGILTLIQFIMQFPRIGDVAPQHSLREEIARLRQLIEVMLSTRLVLRTDGGAQSSDSQSSPRIHSIRYAVILIGSAFLLPIASLLTGPLEIGLAIVIAGALSGNVGDGIGILAYRQAVERHGRATETPDAPTPDDIQFDDSEITSNQSEVLERLNDLRGTLEEILEELEDQFPVITYAEVAERANLAQDISNRVADAVLEEIQESTRVTYSDFAEDFNALRSQMDYWQESVADREQVDDVRDELNLVQERLDAIESSVGPSEIDFSKFEERDARSDFEQGNWRVVPGIGSNLESRLQERIRNIQDLQEASLGELEEIKGVGPMLAYRLKRLGEYISDYSE